MFSEREEDSLQEDKLPRGTWLTYQPTRSGVRELDRRTRSPALDMALLSNIMSNVPATRLILSVATVPMSAVSRIAVAAGLAGNIGPIGSFANILALMIIKRNGLSVKRTLIFQFIIGTISFLPALL